jgi:DNA repair protein RadA/Sms
MKTKTRFVCSGCGHAVPRWVGRCPGCAAWNTMEEKPVESPSRGRGRRPGASAPPAGVIPLGDIEADSLRRYCTGIEELDRVLGGGLVPGSVVLVAGDPGVGKSTLLLQSASAYAALGLKALYVSAEESEKQLRLRAARLGDISGTLGVLASNRLDAVAPVVEEAGADLVIVDSVQAIHHPDSASAPGSVGQVRDNTLFFVELAKQTHVPVILVGHVTKDGTVAGPRVVEHMVDAVLYLEGDRYHSYRLLRAAKNRFGPTHEVGLFEMRDAGLQEVKNPSKILLEERRPGTSGSAVVVSMEGTRPLLLEVQALVGSAGYTAPRRVAMGLDPKRLAVLLAVLERRAGCSFSTCDVFANVTGGFRVVEPGVDLALVMAVASSYHDVPLDPQTVFVGEVGLGGEVRRVGRLGHRVREAAKLGFETAVIPRHGASEVSQPPLRLVPVSRIDEAMQSLLGVSPPGRKRTPSREENESGSPRRPSPAPRSDPASGGPVQ